MFYVYEFMVVRVQKILVERLYINYIIPFYIAYFEIPLFSGNKNNTDYYILVTDKKQT